MSGSPFSIRQALAVVPPMSNDISRSRPSTSAIVAGGERAAAGPLSIMRTGLRRAVSAPTTPPELSMISGALGNLLAREPVAQAAQIGLRDRHRVGVDARGRGAREFADLRGDIRRQRDEQVGQELADPLADGALVRRIGEAVEKADGERATLRSRAPRRPPRPAACRARPARCRRRGCVPPPRRSARRGPAAPETRSADRTSRNGARCGCAGRRETRR